MKKIFKPSDKQLLATDKVYKLKYADGGNDRDLSESLGISRNTLYTRLQKSNWKKSELTLINILKLK